MRFSLFQKLYIHHRSSCGPGADRALCLARPAPCEGSAARGWIRGCGRVDTAWRPTAQAAIHPLGSAHSFCVSTRHHTDVTLTHTHSHSLTHTHTHAWLRTQILRKCLAPHRRHTYSPSEPPPFWSEEGRFYSVCCHVGPAFLLEVGHMVSVWGSGAGGSSFVHR